ncbi:hypothetical protein PFICI_09260 [Pestalotiopsis fici W106-1]|uniref:AAA+ ATPase domain-containing protein n=1 Tax=Pestalotiopsis fici (strain W106-1 / CGMCC3.15140) TaxID=1229662 RepID=W3X208_PESFW|nr:uncharacterized protein PFICI_09260 [Pestalotiopsis fici W106-1]ETS79407.1 hypothetical protein PFICI_09260 [Pestalotiopsis fici W106-1]
MYAQWARASRSAALRPPTAARLPTRPAAGSCFHSSAPVQEAAGGASDPSPSPSPNDESPNGSDNPKNGDGSSGNNGTTSQESGKEEEDLSGDKGMSNGDARGRARRTNGGPKSRTTRLKVPEELPPVHLPKDFAKLRVVGKKSNQAWSKQTWRFPGKHYRPLLSTKVLPTKDLDKEDLERLAGMYAAQTSPKTGSIMNETTLDEDALDLRLIYNKASKGHIPDANLRELDSVWTDMFELTAWTSDEVENLKNNSRSKIDSHADPDWLAEEIEFVSLRGSVMLVAACNSALLSMAELELQTAVDSHHLEVPSRGFIDLIESQDPAEKAKAYEVAQYHAQRVKPYNLASPDEKWLLRNVLVSKLPQRPSLGIAHYETLCEATASIRADLNMVPPKHIRAADIKRPITVLNFEYYSGYSWPRMMMRDIAMELDANMVTIHAPDLAYVAGKYLGQDPILAPGPLSLLGYKAAENAGRVQHRKAEQSDDESRTDIPFSIVMHAEKPKKEGKKNIMDYFLGEPNRASKTDEKWNDLKVNAVLEQFVLAADTHLPGGAEAAQQRPLVIHVHDFNALNMDDECGSVVMGKLRTIVDDLWAAGRKVVIVGTCSSSGVPSAYKSAMKELRTTERVIDFRPPSTEAPESEMNATAAAISHHSISDDINTALKGVTRREHLTENSRNIYLMMQNLVSDVDSEHLFTPEFELKGMNPDHYPSFLSKKLLPVSEVYRIVKIMHGLRTTHPDQSMQTVFEDAMRLVKHIDDAQSHHDAPEKAELETKSNTMNDPGRSATDYEKRFMSAIVDPKNLRTTFNDIHAPAETIDSIKMLTQLSLLRPEAFAYGVLATDRIPGCLLYGPPGTGKTLLAKAVAKESGANMIEVSGASINQMYVGESEKNIRALFSMAKKKEPLVIFIDEADALLGARGGRNDAAGRRDVINQFLREWDGMEASKAFIMVATNRPFDLDEAVLRRLPRKLLVDLPLEGDRAAILKIHLKMEKLDDTVSIEQIAKRTPLYSGSDLKNVCVAAAMAAVKEELEASEKHSGPDPYVWPEKRVLNNRHFEKALAEIPASVSEDMATLSAIKKFDERYGEKKTRRKRRGMGFEVVPESTDSHEARVRSADK